LVSSKRRGRFNTKDTVSMPKFSIPIIREQDYESFRRILKDDIPATYEAWRNRQLRQKAQLGAQWLDSLAEFIEIEIDPNEFTAYCDRTHSNYTVESLDRLAIEKAFGKND
jgi:hypothetical protein